MVWRYFCDECGSDKEVAHLAISAEVSRGNVSMPEELVEEGLKRKEAFPDDILAYDRDLCSSCRHLRITEFLDLLEKLKKRRST